MTHPIVYRFSILIAALLVCPIQAPARPIDFSEISLLVRAHESEASIKQEIAQRKLIHPLTQPQESILKSQGASDSLIQSLRDPNLVAPKEETAAVESAAGRGAKVEPAETWAHERRPPSVHIFNVAYGHPINLSQWGGLDYEIAFFSYRFAGEDHVQPAFIDNARSRTVVSRIVPTGATSEGELLTEDWYPTNGVRNWRYTPYNGSGGTLYNGRGDFQDTRSFNFGDSVGYSSYSVSQPIVIDWDNPKFFDGQPYTFYPVYGSGGVSLYYISSSSDSVQLAVSTLQ